ncbi:MAG: leucyl/phenylalanyl-tRNA--protein transferase [Phycisphaerales bacterium]
MRKPERQFVELMLEAYRRGLFPMAEPGSQDLAWYSPDPRAVVPIDRAPGEPGGVRVSRSLRSRLRARPFRVTTNAAFEEVIRACAEPRARDPGGDDGSWIDERIIALYVMLHHAGRAHSVEAWLPALPGAEDGRPRLVGGLYGVHIGRAFFGESMFCRPALGGTDASKVCLVHLVRHLRARGFTLLDSQFTSPHMASLGVIEIPRRTYLARLRKAAEEHAEWGPWTGEDGIEAAPGAPG